MVSMKKKLDRKATIVRLVRDGGIILCLALVFILGARMVRSDFFEAPQVPQIARIIPHAFGYDLRQVTVSQSIIEEDQFLGDLLQAQGVPYSKIIALEQEGRDVFDVRSIRAGKAYSIIHDTCYEDCLAFVYEPSPFYYVTCSFDEEEVCVQRTDRPVTTMVETAAGRIETSLWNAMMDQDLSPAVIDLMEDALASAVDFHHTQVGDEFKLIYEKQYIDNVPVSLGKVLGAYWKNNSGQSYSIYYDSENYSGYFDEEGRPTKSTFLRSPVKFSRISSRYNLRRFHPIKKQRIPHMGTDYAAPRGTPIRSTADGVITKAAYTRNNGKYVKVKHDKTYQTQYLHMQKFAKGIRPGVKVKQGETIGYVGSTGLATGPHVCYRFWKNGHQVDPLRENFPPSEPMPQEALPDFFRTRDEIKVQLDAIATPPATAMASSLAPAEPSY